MSFFDKVATLCGYAQASEEGSPTAFMLLTLGVLSVLYAWLKYVGKVLFPSLGANPP
jgi:hypothetical protein